MFADREQAGRLLARALGEYRGADPVILAIPRGAVPMGRVVADELGGELDVVLVRKIGSPYGSEFALGSVDESGWLFVADYAERHGGTPQYMERQMRRELDVLRARREMYTPFRHPLDVAGRVVIVVDDGLATGSTMIAALHATRAKNPARLICAVPVAPADTLERMRPYCDEVVCLSTPANFQAVGQFYDDFGQVSDDEVVRVLRAAGS